MARDVKAHRGLTTERVVDAALGAADAGGIEAVSLRRLAGALEVTPMAIYRHVRNKSHLLDLMVERLLDQVDLAPAETATWQERAKSIVIEPEADIWLWGSDNAMQQVLRWTDSMPIRAWLQEKGFDFTSEGKPKRPKEAFEEVVRKCQLPRSSSLYSEITGKVSLSRCTDSAYQRL